MCKKGESIYKQLNDRGWLKQKYLVERSSTVKIADIVGCNSGSVFCALKKNHIQTRTHSEAGWGKHHSKESRKKLSDAKKGTSMYWQIKNKEWLQQKYLLEKMSAREIAEEIGCSGRTVLRGLVKWSILRRTVSESQMGGKNQFYGKHHTEKTKKKISDANTKLTFCQRKINHAMKIGIGSALKGAKAGRHWENLVDYTLAELMQTLEKEFRGGMSWKNYGLWHVDHIIPLARFEYDSAEDQEFGKAWSLGNLQPLWADENVRKHTKFRFF